MTGTFYYQEKMEPGIYPALDIPKSISRVMTEITTKEHQEIANKFKKLVSIYLENRDLVLMGDILQVKIWILMKP